MPAKKVSIKIDLKQLKRQYSEHTTRCLKIAEDVDKWGKKKRPNLRFLKVH